MPYKRPIGTQDITPDVVGQWRLVEDTFRRVAGCYGYRELRTPIFEDTDLFLRSVGQETDIVRKEMYTFADRSERSLTLRAEGTAPAVRAYLENNLWGQDRERLVKLYYIAPIFRYDRPQAGRYRQHHQCGLEALGSANPAVDVEIIALCWQFFAELGLTGITLRLNSVGCPVCAPVYVEKLTAALASSLGQLCEDCQRRYEANPLRVLDCKLCHEYVALAPKITEELCGECDEHLSEVRRTLDALNLPYTLDHTIVRGLDYYTKTAFEFQVEGIGAQASIAGGGRYDGLVEQCGGRATPGVGIGMGLERLLLAREICGCALTEEAPRTGVLIVTLGDTAWTAGLQLMQQLRQAGLRADVDYRRRSLKAQMRFADGEGFQYAVILGEDEIASGVAGLKDLVGGEQTAVPLAELVNHLR
jgi:histidyl-tRNA synthetase